MGWDGGSNTIVHCTLQLTGNLAGYECAQPPQTDWFFVSVLRDLARGKWSKEHLEDGI